MARPAAGERARHRAWGHRGDAHVAAPVRTQPAGRLIYALRALPIAAGVLQLGAHPDDEDTGMLVTMSRRMGARAAYWSATRGEGGQNKRGRETEDALGIIRTWESLQARELDGGEVLYGPFYDYGFDKHGEDALRRWGRDELVREMARAIRTVQPMVVISRWNGGASDGHGHHQAIGLVADEAFDAAGDPARFPELSDQGLVPWRPLKLYHSVAGDWQPGEASHFGQVVEEYERAGYLRLDTGELDPVAGLTFQEQAHMAVNRHRSQGMGFVPAPGSYYYYYRRVRSVLDFHEREASLFDGFDPTLAGLADHPGGNSDELRQRLQRALSAATDAIAAFDQEAAAEAGLLVLQGAETLWELRADLESGTLDAEGAEALDRFVSRKAEAFEQVAAQCLGLRLDCDLDRPRTTPARPVRVEARVWNGGPEPVEVDEIELAVPDGWTVRPIAVQETEPTATTSFSATYEVEPPADTAPSVPYWLGRQRGPYRYEWPPSAPLGLPLNPPLVSAAARLRVGGRGLLLTAAGSHTSGFLGGFRRLPLSVLPPIAVSPRRLLEQVATHDESIVVDLLATVRCIEDDGAVGELVLGAPDGWEVDPRTVRLQFSAAGETETMRFALTVPAGTPAGVHELIYDVESEGRPSGFDLEPVRLAAEGAIGPADEVNCGAEAFRVRPASVQVNLVDAQFVSQLRIGYVDGMEEEILESLDRFGLDVSRLSDTDLEFGELAHFDVIVVGPNAYNLRDALRENAARLLEFAAAGGTLVVQYQAYGYDAPGLAPYPFSYHQPHDRVTDPTARVELLAPKHPVLSLPNEICREDFDGWVHDRGLYFFGEWDPRYEPILACADAGEEPHSGGLLVAQYGRGVYAYAAYSFFREIPAGVPGATRLFANLLGLAEAQLRKRVAILRRLELMDGFSERELEELAHAMSERSVEAGEHLTRQGSRGDELFILLEGTAEAIDERSGVARVVGVIEAVDSLGELEVLGNMRRAAGLRAKTDLTILALAAEDLHGWLTRHPELAVRLMARVTARLPLPQEGAL